MQTHYERDCLRIVEAAQASPDTFARCATFVALTIQQPFFKIKEQMDSVDSFGSESQYLWGTKRKTYEYAWSHKQALHKRIRLCKLGRITLDDLILDLLSIPGLGIVKASFLAQLTTGKGACLDVHNLRLLGLAESAFKTPKTLQVETIKKRIATYNAIWRRLGSSDDWWSHWCDALAVKYPTRFVNGAEVSALHAVCCLTEKESACFV